MLLPYAFALATVLSPAFAADRTPAEATAHAIAEEANAIAQGKITMTPTPSPTSTPSPTPSPTPTSTPSPTDTPAPTPTPEPCWLLDEETGEIWFSEDGTPQRIDCPVLEAAQVLPPGGPADDGLAFDPTQPVPDAPPPIDPTSPDEQPTPIVVVIVATAGPIPTLRPQAQEYIYVQQPPPSPPQVIYVVVTPTPLPAATVQGATLPTLAPTATLPAPTPSVDPTTTPEPVPTGVGSVADTHPDQGEPGGPAPPAEPAAATLPHAPPPAPQLPTWELLGFWLGVRRTGERFGGDLHILLALYKAQGDLWRLPTPS